MRCGGCAVSLGVKSAHTIIISLNISDVLYWLVDIFRSMKQALIFGSNPFSESPKQERKPLVQLNVMSLSKNRKRAQGSKWFTRGVSMAKKWMHRRTGVLVQGQVYVPVYFVWWVWRALNRCHEPAHTHVCTCAHVCAVCPLALGDEGGVVWLVYALIDDCFNYL